eukprot:TRINITY_DN47504_c0_g1_i1.p1 TRINITY_DN47504_c0_g1~~TRINITY_DN47504_c0_g1_i1.p1  ORF type:complete len:608 (-),score=53.00 TRINITY_DN47504_c0_g1_i1:193-2016(-)
MIITPWRLLCLLRICLSSDAVRLGDDSSSVVNATQNVNTDGNDDKCCCKKFLETRTKMYREALRIRDSHEKNNACPNDGEVLGLKRDGHGRYILYCCKPADRALGCFDLFDLDYSEQVRDVVIDVQDTDDKVCKRKVTARNVGGCSGTAPCCVCRRYRNNEFWKNCAWPKREYSHNVGKPEVRPALNVSVHGQDKEIQLCCMWEHAEDAQKRILRNGDFLRYRFIASHCLGPDMEASRACEMRGTKPEFRKKGVYARAQQILRYTHGLERAWKAAEELAKNTAAFAMCAALEVGDTPCSAELRRRAAKFSSEMAEGAHQAWTATKQVADGAARSIARGAVAATKWVTKKGIEMWNDAGNCLGFKSAAQASDKTRGKACWETIKRVGTLVFGTMTLVCVACGVGWTIASASWDTVRLAAEAWGRHQGNALSTESGTRAAVVMAFGILVIAGTLAVEVATAGIVNQQAVFVLFGADVLAGDIASGVRFLAVRALEKILESCYFIADQQSVQLADIRPDHDKLGFGSATKKKLESCHDVMLEVEGNDEDTCGDQLGVFLAGSDDNLEVLGEDAELPEGNHDSLPEGAQPLDELWVAPAEFGAIGVTGAWF